ncbi:hypothetical protein GCM10022222_29910 [Amycolatopsis ultiminotia]|uniref:Uncharacterized protein n=1 Tax=Amycolatopsis ultiminotia TaxID=543629 RepID=A0ABP6W246_9PSEU
MRNQAGRAAVRNRTERAGRVDRPEAGSRAVPDTPPEPAGRTAPDNQTAPDSPVARSARSRRAVPDTPPEPAGRTAPGNPAAVTGLVAVAGPVRVAGASPPVAGTGVAGSVPVARLGDPLVCS